MIRNIGYVVLLAACTGICAMEVPHQTYDRANPVDVLQWANDNNYKLTDKEADEFAGKSYAEKVYVQGVSPIDQPIAMSVDMALAYARELRRLRMDSLIGNNSFVGRTNPHEVVRIAENAGVKLSLFFEARRIADIEVLKENGLAEQDLDNPLRIRSVALRADLLLTDQEVNEIADEHLLNKLISEGLFNGVANPFDVICLAKERGLKVNYEEALKIADGQLIRSGEAFRDLTNPFDILRKARDADVNISFDLAVKAAEAHSQK